ncbi:uncharacterized protein LOC143591997 [Bidens hawaiensis]|uniref:uncharacterized protein LOC143591997 n=1 Tax=Bidens hawaiensis TaxID=980011 RepID=UPI004049E83F
MANVKKLLVSTEVTIGLDLFCWNNWIPLKVNVFGWRCLQNRLATLVELARRKIIPDSKACPMCGCRLETSEHLFTSCIVACLVWHNISTWCKIPQIFVFSLKDIFDLHKFIPNSNRRMRIFQSIVLIACWCIWQARNKRIYEEENVDVQKIVRQIKSYSFLWIKARSRR